MTLWQVSREWEYNGRDDSDWYVVCYDDEADILKRIETHSTRYGGSAASSINNYMPYSSVNPLDTLPEEIRTKALAALEQRWRAVLTGAEQDRIERATGKPGERVRVKEEIRNRPREITSEPCGKCSGSGKWINPRNSDDKRDCFGCRGKGNIERSKVAAKGSGKKMVVIPVGTCGVVKQSFNRKSQYGTWDYGTRVLVRADDGREFWAELRKLRLDEEFNQERVNAAVERCKRDAYTLFATANPGLRFVIEGI